MIKWLSDLVCTLRIDFECVGLVGYVGIMVQHDVGFIGIGRQVSLEWI